MVKNLLAIAGDVGSIPGSGKAPREGNGYPLQYSCLKKSPSTGETGRLQFMRSRRIVYDSTTKQQHEVVMLLSLPFYQRKNSEAEVTKLVQGC